MLLWLVVVVLLVWTLRLNQHKIPGPLSLPFCGSLASMTLLDNQHLRFPYRVMHR